MAKNHDKKKGDDLLINAGAFSAMLIVILGFVWLLGGHQIVYYSTPVLRWLGVPWAVFNPERWSAINEAYVVFRNYPAKIGLINYIAFVNACLLPLAILWAAVGAGLLIRRFTHASASYRRQLKPDQVATEISKTFTNIIPVLHLGPDLVKDKLPLWRRQTFPEDVWTQEKFGNKPLAVGARLFEDRVEGYFRGGEAPGGAPQLRGGRRFSRMLGYLVVNLVEDTKNQDRICFPDRMSSQGKVLYALLAAHAFGGREGKLDYQKAVDQLNRSCAGQANGLPRLTVAQWIYQKYRMNATARKLFGVHHWEYTYLSALFRLAKLTGKTTHTDWIWLKPLDRIMFYVLNTVGRATPPVEAAAAFAQLNYEIQCARSKRLPLTLDNEGKLTANICVSTAVEALSTEFIRYQAAHDDDELWWKDIKPFGAATAAALALSTREAAQALKRVAGVDLPPESKFDASTSARAAAAARAAQDAVQARVDSLLS